jgi:aspartyl aminopeptidase
MGLLSPLLNLSGVLRIALIAFFLENSIKKSIAVIRKNNNNMLWAMINNQGNEKERMNKKIIPANIR